MALSALAFSADEGQHSSRFDVSVEGQKCSAIIDTGAAYSILNLDSAARRFGIDVRKPDGRMVGMDNSGFIRTYTWQFQELNIGGIVVTEPKITLFPNLLRVGAFWEIVFFSCA